MKLHPAPLAIAFLALGPAALVQAQTAPNPATTTLPAATLSQAEVQSLLDAAGRSDAALREQAAALMDRSPAHARAVYEETLGLVAPEQSRMLESMWAERSPDIAQPASPQARSPRVGVGVNLGWVLGGAVAVGAGAAASGGGGGGGGGSAPPAPAPDPGPGDPIDDGELPLPSQPAPPPPGGSEPAPDPVAPGPLPDPGPMPGDDDSAKALALPSEYRFTGGYNLTYAHVAHERGFTGSGTRIAIIDSGVRSSHLELQGQIAGHYNALTGSTTAEAGRDSGDHGTHVAGMLVGRRNAAGSVGYAPGAQLLNVRFTDAADEISVSDRQLAAGFAWARVNGARFFNNSWGINTTAAEFGRAGVNAYYRESLAEWRAGVDSGRVYVWATGNEGGAQPLVLSALPQLYPELTYNWVAVTSVNSTDGQISSFANACGDAAAWCVAAPGTRITSSINRTNTSYGTYSGTSTATPAVTGALAVISQAFPTLDSSQVVQRLFVTANKDGIYADQSLYGQGLIDLEKATRPVGQLVLVSDNGQPLDLDSAALVLGQPFGQNNPLAGLEVLAADSLGAGFGVDLGQPVTLRRYRHDTDLGFERLSRQVHSAEHSGGAMRWVSSGRAERQAQVWHLERGAGLTLGQVDDLDLLDGQAGFTGQSQLQASLSAPYWVQQPGEFASALRQRFDLGSADLNLTFSANEIRQGAAVGLALRAGAAYEPTLEVGYVHGRDGLFNTQGRGLYDLDRTSSTLFAGLRGRFRHGALELSHASHVGQSRVQAQGLFSDMQPVITSSWLIGGRYRVDNGDSWGLVIQQPLRVESAHSRVRLATGYAGNQFDIRQLDIDLAPAGRQINLEASWQRSLSPDTDLKLSWLGIREPGHQAQAAPLQVLMGQWQHRF